MTSQGSQRPMAMDTTIAVAEPPQLQQAGSLTAVPREAPEAPLEYMPQLDGLRALAVSAVVLQHYHILEGGAAYGVHLFFVLSGFLITGILMRSKAAIEAGAQSWRHAFRQFYIRRVLRIFPLYYLVVFIAIAVDAKQAREYAPWLLTYTINLKMAAQEWFIEHFAHFWSLAVEEQYYLIWPCLILLLPRRLLVPAAVTMTAIAPLYRFSRIIDWQYLGAQDKGYGLYISTLTALDSLGIGSLIAIMMSSERGRLMIARWMRVAVPLIGLVLAFAVNTNKWWGIVFFDTATAMVFGWLIYRASSGFKGIAGRLLSAPPVVWVGRISYGIYVYHPLVLPVAAVLAAALGFSLPGGTWRKLTLCVLTVLVAALSWYSFERPINNLKGRFR